jgi:hypothetical protein
VLFDPAEEQLDGPTTPVDQRDDRRQSEIGRRAASDTSQLHGPTRLRSNRQGPGKRLSEADSFPSHSGRRNRSSSQVGNTTLAALLTVGTVIRK